MLCPPSVWVSTCASILSGRVVVPAQQCIRLHNYQCLLPRAQLAGEKHKQHSVALGQGRAFDLSFEDDELLTQESVSHYQFRLAAGKVSCNAENQVTVGLCAAMKTLFDGSPQARYTLSRRERG